MAGKVLLSGYYGFDNAGDEAVLYAIIESLRKQQVTDITVLSHNPSATSSQYNVNAVDRWSKKGIYQKLKKADLFISGGGSLLQDVTSKNGILYYLGIIALAQILKKPVLIYAQGIGPIKHKRNRWLCAKILNKATAITVRDYDSQAELRSMGVNQEIIVGVDPVLGIAPSQIDSELGEQILMRNGWQKMQGQTLIIALRPWQNSNDFLREVALCGDHFSACGWQVVFLPMHYQEDNAICEKTAAIMHQKAIVLTEHYSPLETMAILQQADVVLGMRLHALIMAAVAQKPLVALSYDPKIDSFMHSLGLKYQVAVEQVDSALFIKLLEESLIAQEWQKVGDRFLQAVEKANLPAQLAVKLAAKH